MENEPPTISVQEDGRGSVRGRIMGKLFGRDRDRKVSQEGPPPNSEDLNDFLRGPSDKLQVAHAAPPMLAKLDIRTASRYPNALDVHGANTFQQDPASRPRPPSSRKPLRKGLIVRFVDTYPEVMGEGGDECEVPTVEISRRRKPRPPMATAITAPPRQADIPDQNMKELLGAQARNGSSPPAPLRRTQTGLSTTANATGPEIPAGVHVPASFLESPAVSRDEKRRSFIEVHQAEMREAEGQAFAHAVRSGTDSTQQPNRDRAMPSSISTSEAVTGDMITESPTDIQAPQLHPLPQPPVARPPPSVSPQPNFAQPGPVAQVPQVSQAYAEDHPKALHHLPLRQALPQEPQYQPYTPARGTHAHDTSHHPETPERLKRTPLLNQSPTSIHSTASSLGVLHMATRQGSRTSERDNASTSSPRKANPTMHDAAVSAAEDAMEAFVARTRHLFELFRLHSESVRPLLTCSPQDLARAGLWWFLTGRTALENAIRERPAGPEYQQKHEMAKQQAYTDLAKGYWLTEEIIPDIIRTKRLPSDPGVEEACAALGSNLRKLAVSMKRNNFLPPEEAFLPQTLDRSIWIEYPQLTQDVISLLWGSSSSSLAQAMPTTSGMSLIEALPLGDMPSAFSFGRFQTDVYLTEQGRESQHLYFPCYLTIVRPQQQPDIVFVVASQNGAVQLRISGNRSFGPVWEDVLWRSDNYTLEVKLPRGFALAIQCSQPNYKMLWNMYDFSAKVHSSLYPRQDEVCIFRSTLQAFQYFDNDPQSRHFPKESTPNCDVALFERILREGAAAGPRAHHRGYRIAVVTGLKTKTLSGINQSFGPQSPVQYGFLRSDANDPALSLKFENGRLKGNMVLSFAGEKERLRMHSLLIGAALSRDEQVFCEVPLKCIWFSERFGDTSQPGLRAVSVLPWQRVRVINHENDGDRPPCVLADKLRLVCDFKDGTFTDRINVAPGELRVRLDVRNPSCMMVFRQPQTDATMAIMEAKVSRETPQELAQALESIRQAPTFRTFMFPTVADLHKFQTAITGFNVLFDGIASAFAIARRRMVVPIHKKWEAGATRIQVVQQDGTLQLLVFFDEFAHGQCMGFGLKGTDVFESFGRGGKSGVKVVDAKFPLPKVLAPDVDGAQEAADAGFLCLDLPELPGEHDDISIIFENEAERDKLISCLPAPVKGSRLPKIKGLSG